MFKIVSNCTWLILMIVNVIHLFTQRHIKLDTGIVSCRSELKVNTGVSEEQLVLAENPGAVPIQSRRGDTRGVPAVAHSSPILA
jgi:hypothetical protein